MHMTDDVTRCIFVNLLRCLHKHVVVKFFFKKIAAFAQGGNSHADIKT